METLTKQKPTTIYSLISLSLIIIVVIFCFLRWQQTGITPFLFASLGGLVVSPLWYKYPMDFNKPVFDKPKYSRKFSKLDTVASFLGYPLILIAVIWGAFVYFA